MKTKSIFEDTPIIPEIVADTVVSEVMNFTRRELPAEYAQRLADRAEHIYANNEQFAKKMRARGNKGRDTLYVFMRHWLSSMLKKEQQAIFDMLPTSFHIGHPLTK